MNPYIFGGELLVFLIALWLVLIFAGRRFARETSPIVEKLEEMTATFGLVPTTSHVGRLDYEERSFWVQHLRLQADRLERDIHQTPGDDDDQPDPLPFDPNKEIRVP